jgi:hypothetical protein
MPFFSALHFASYSYAKKLLTQQLGYAENSTVHLVSAVFAGHCAF